MSHPFQQHEGPSARWTRVEELLRTARLEGAIMKNPCVSGPGRDEATQRYVASVDQLVEMLGDMADIGLVDEIGRYLLVTYGRA